MYHQAFSDVEFTAQYPVRLWKHQYTAGDVLTVGLVRDWDKDEGMGGGGPWGYGGYPSWLIAKLSGDTGPGHAHTCLTCSKEIEYGDFDCEELDDNTESHDFALCDECAAAGVNAND